MKLVRENINFQRGLDPRKSLGIGSYKIPPAEVILKHKEWAGEETINFYNRFIDGAMLPDKTDSYRKYIYFVVEHGHLTSSSSSVFHAWMEENRDSLTIENIKDALNDLWPTTDEDSKASLIYHAKRLGIKRN